MPRHFIRTFNDYSLDSLLYMHGIEIKDRHTASWDAIMIAQLFSILFEQLRDKNINIMQKLYEYLNGGGGTAHDLILS